MVVLLTTVVFTYVVRITLVFTFTAAVLYANTPPRHSPPEKPPPP
jgi:hypothetical protein